MKRVAAVGLAVIGMVWALVGGAAVHETTLRSYVHQMTDPLTKSSCSAVMIAPGRAMTAGHCMDMEQAYLEIDGRAYPVTEGYRNPDMDLAVLIVPNAPCPCAVVSMHPTKRDETVWAVGYPFGLLQIVTSGTMQGRSIVEGPEYLVITARVGPGMSGGGVFNGQGELVGIISATDGFGLLTLAVELFSQRWEPR